MVCAEEDFRFPLKADIYYATLVQNDIGEMEKSWALGHANVACEVRSDKFNSDTRYSMSAREPFMDTPLLIFGRFRDDIRIASGGASIAPTDIAVTNVRSYCADTDIFVETFGGEHVPTVFELRTFQPFVNPWGQIEYYKVQLVRMEDQIEFLDGITTTTTTVPA